jgi:hypothetical protein
MKKAFAIKSRGLFDPASNKPFKLSRSGIELYLECPRCFFINHRFGIRRPSGPPFNINSLVDRLLKKEFDVHRVNATTHPLMQQYHAVLGGGAQTVRREGSEGSYKARNRI